jgi:hypothetical protein
MRPGADASGPFGAQKLPHADQKLQHLAGEDFGEPRVVEAGDPVEDAGLVRPTLGRLEMEVRVEVEPVAERLDGSDDAGDRGAAGDGLTISLWGPQRRPAEISQLPAVVLEEKPLVAENVWAKRGFIESLKNSARKVWLFGSSAEGTDSAESDIGASRDRHIRPNRSRFLFRFVNKCVTGYVYISGDGPSGPEAGLKEAPWMF